MIKTIPILVCSLLLSCSFFDASDELPMILEVNEVSLTTVANEGSNSHNISAVSVFADGFSIGVFEVPSLIPVLDLDNNRETVLDIFPVIRNNGIGSNPIHYPFYTSKEFSFAFEEEKIIPLDLEFKYVENSSFVVIEDFEGSHIIQDNIDGNPDIEFEKSSDAIYGSFCGKITTTADNPIFEKASSFRYSKDEVQNSPVYLEIDYKNSIPFQIGVLKYSGLSGNRQYKIVLVGTSEWNKIYIELTEELGGTNYNEFQLLFGSAASNDIGSVWIDNIKLVVLK